MLSFWNVSGYISVSLWFPAVGDFFGYSCVPGVKDPEHDPKGKNPRNLCEACIGDENDHHICANNPRERHFGEAGALRCCMIRDVRDCICFSGIIFQNMNIGLLNGFGTKTYMYICTKIHYHLKVWGEYDLFKCFWKIIYQGSINLIKNGSILKYYYSLK